MVLQDLGRRINAAVSDLTRSQNLDEKVSAVLSYTPLEYAANLFDRLSMA